MTQMGKVKEWINTHFPAFKIVYENKYVGMAYDQFASLPGQSQKRILLGGIAGIFLVVFLMLISFFFSYYRQSSIVSQSEAMKSMLHDFDRSRQEQDSKLFLLERNNQLQGDDGMKRFIMDQARFINISPRLVKVEEMPTGKEEGSTKQAVVKLEKVNLSQLMALLQAVEYGNYALKVNFLRVRNDEKVRGYLHAEFSIEAHFLQGGVEG